MNNQNNQSNNQQQHNHSSVKYQYLYGLKQKAKKGKKKRDFQAKVPERYAKNFSKAIIATKESQVRANAEPTWPEKVFANIMHTLGIKFQKEYEILGKFFDFYLESWEGGPEGFKPMLVEIHGIYWHGKNIDTSDPNTKYKVHQVEAKVNDIVERSISRAKNLDLLVVWEDRVGADLILNALKTLCENNVKNNEKDPEIIELD